jgi:hypothetical protein
MSRSTAMDMLGLRFGSLVVIARAPTRHRSAVWTCRCDCGRTKDAQGAHLRAGRSRCICSGGKEQHGMTADTGLYRSWTSMLERCSNPSRETYGRYGGRGITVCSEWRSFAAFAAWANAAGYARRLQIDRYPDNDGNYEPCNCRWVTSAQNNQNRSDNVRLTHDGRTMTAVEWARELALPPAAIYRRVKAGWPVEKALSPINRRDA